MSKHNQPQSIYFASRDNIETVQVQVGNLQFTGAQLVGALMKQLFYQYVFKFVVLSECSTPCMLYVYCLIYG